ncbi:MAG: hypothetical protein Kow0047_05760 [Anaerolineae bacterium]
MHTGLAAGLSAFAAHFWYAIPVSLAILALTRLQPKAHLIGLAAYSQDGRLIYRTGDLPFAAFAERRALAAVRRGDQPRLHELVLPSGVHVYFLQHGQGKLLVAFSGPASVEDIRSVLKEAPRLTDSEFNLLEGLKPELAAPGVQLLKSPLKRQILALFRDLPYMAMEVNDLASWLNAPGEETRRALDELLHLGLLECETALDFAFYRPARSPEAQAQLRELYDWLDRWQTTLDRLQHALGAPWRRRDVPHKNASDASDQAMSHMGGTDGIIGREPAQRSWIDAA